MELKIRQPRTVSCAVSGSKVGKGGLERRYTCLSVLFRLYCYHIADVNIADVNKSHINKQSMLTAVNLPQFPQDMRDPSKSNRMQVLVECSTTTVLQIYSKETTT